MTCKVKVELKAQPQTPRKGQRNGSDTMTDVNENGKCLTTQKGQVHQQKYISKLH